MVSDQTNHKENPMAYESEYTLLEQVIQMLAANGDNKFSRVIEVVVNEAMKIERAKALNAEVANSEAEVNWRSFLEGLVRRGMHGLRMITSDDHSGLRAAIDAVFPGILWQRCQFHLQQNAHSYVTKKDDIPLIAADIRKVFNAPDRENAERYLQQLVEKYQKTHPRLAAWADENIREGLSVFNIPENHRRKMRTSNLAERQMKEINRRTKVVGVFPNAASLLRLAAAMLIEQNDQWQNDKRYLPESNDRPALNEIYRKKVA